MTWIPRCLLVIRGDFLTDLAGLGESSFGVGFGSLTLSAVLDSLGSLCLLPPVSIHQGRQDIPGGGGLLVVQYPIPYVCGWQT